MYKNEEVPCTLDIKSPSDIRVQCFLGELHRAKKIACNSKIEIRRIVNKYAVAEFPTRFAHCIIDNFESGEENLLIPQWLFVKRKAFTIYLSFSMINKKFVKTFISKLIYFTNEKCKFNVVWNARKVQSLFPLKDKAGHYSCVIYRGDCSCDQNYI